MSRQKSAQRLPTRIRQSVALHRSPDTSDILPVWSSTVLLQWQYVTVSCYRSALSGSECSASRSDRFNPGYSLNNMRGGPHSRSKSCGNRRLSCSPIRSRTVRSPAPFCPVRLRNTRVHVTECNALSVIKIRPQNVSVDFVGCGGMIQYDTVR